MGFCDRIYHKTKLKKDAVPFRRTYVHTYLLSGYFQMTLGQENQSLTALITPLGRYMWK